MGPESEPALTGMQWGRSGGGVSFVCSESLPASESWLNPHRTPPHLESLHCTRTLGCCACGAHARGAGES